MDLIQTCYEEPKDLLKRIDTPEGFSASLGGLYVDEVWGRDGSITCLGATLSEDEKLIESSRKTLTTLKEWQGPLGQVPNRIRLRSRTVNFYAVDGCCWWIIAVAAFWQVTRDKEFLMEFWPSVEKAISWLKYQDVDNTGLVNSPPAGDWIDSSIQRSGLVLYNNVLYDQASRCVGEMARALGVAEVEDVSPERIKARANCLFWPESGMPQDEWIRGWDHTFYEEVIDPNRDYYLNFLSFETYDSRCDVIGNCLAVLWEVADQQKVDRILGYLAERQISDPYPVRVLDPTILSPGISRNPKVDLHRPAKQQNLPFQYHNAGIWPWVGGFYILALLKANKHELAQAELEKLAHANSLGNDRGWEFNEWLHGKTGVPLGTAFQAWSAGGYILAYRAALDGVWNL